MFPLQRCKQHPFRMGQIFQPETVPRKMSACIGALQPVKAFPAFHICSAALPLCRKLPAASDPTLCPLFCPWDAKGGMLQHSCRRPPMAKAGWWLLAEILLSLGLLGLYWGLVGPAWGHRVCSCLPIATRSLYADLSKRLYIRIYMCIYMFPFSEGL